MVFISAKSRFINDGKVIVSEIPFQVQKSALVEQLANLVSEKKVEGVKDIRDESDKEGMRIVIDLQREAYPQKVLNRLYKFSSRIYQFPGFSHVFKVQHHG